MSVIGHIQTRAQKIRADQLPEPSVLTQEGVRRLQNEIEYLQRIRLPVLVDWIHDLTSEGLDDDVGEYERARSEFEYLQRRIRYINNQLALAVILVDPVDAQVAQLGSRVTVLDNEMEATYRIVGGAEADPSRGFISDQSPLGNAVLGRCKGDRVEVQTPDGPVEFRVVEII